MEETIEQRAELMGKWCSMLFWIVIAAEIAALLGDTMLGNSLAVIFGVAYGAALLQLTPLSSAYRTAGICALGAALVVLVVGAIPISDEGSILYFLVAIPGSILSLVGDYHEFHAHAEMLKGVEDGFAGKWENLWKWNMRTILLTMGSGLLVVISPAAFAMVGFAAMIGMVVVHIAKIVYLYRMSKFFRNYEPL